MGSLLNVLVVSIVFVIYFSKDVFFYIWIVVVVGFNSVFGY